jgi:hypothetical protein
VRLLSQLGAAEGHDARPVFAERLGQWLGWADAISLSSALNAAPATTRPAAKPLQAEPEQAEVQRVRALLAHTIHTDRDLAPPKPRGSVPLPEPEFPHFRRRYLARQQSLELALTALRGRLRGTLAGGSPALARLAAVDAVMEQVLGAQERRLLAGVPALLERHFEELRLAQATAWLDTFCQDLRGVLLAELDLRMQPVEGLLAALRSHSRP